MRNIRVNKLTKVLSCILAVMLLIAPINTSASPNSDAIDDYIYHLDYRNDLAIVHNGEPVSNDFKTLENREEISSFTELKREKKTFSAENTNILVVDSINDRTYPGAMLRANSKLADNKPDYVVTERKPITIHLDIPNFGEGGTMIVPKPAYSSVNSAINVLLENWFTVNGKVTTNNIFYNETMAYSSQQVKAALQIDIKNPSYQMDVDFDAISKGEKQVMLVLFKQIYYSVTVDQPKKPSDFIGDNITVDELKYLKGLDKNNPPVYVGRVAYGRHILVKLETSSLDTNVKTAFGLLLQGKTLEIEANAAYSEIVKNTKFTAVVLGGGSAQHHKIISRDWEEIRSVIHNNVEFTRTNPGYPLSYVTNFLKDNAFASVNSNTEYVETTATEYKNSSLILKNNGIYIAKFYIEWDELRKNNVTGEYELVEGVGKWEGNGKPTTKSYSTIIPLKPNVRNLRIKAIGRTGLVWEPWRTIIDSRYVPLVKTRTVELTGTSLNQKATIDPEP